MKVILDVSLVGRDLADEGKLEHAVSKVSSAESAFWRTRMFLVYDPDTKTHVFLLDDPQPGFTGNVEEDVTLEGTETMNDWPDGEMGPEPCFGQAPNNAKLYRAFRRNEECKKAGYKFLGLGFIERVSWEDYKQGRKGT